MSEIRWSTDLKSKWSISQKANRFAYHYCLACGEAGAPERWREIVRVGVSEAVPEDLAPYLLRYPTREGTTLNDLIGAGLPRDQARTIRQGRRRVYCKIVNACCRGFEPD